MLQELLVQPRGRCTALSELASMLLVVSAGLLAHEEVASAQVRRSTLSLLRACIRAQTPWVPLLVTPC